MRLDGDVAYAGFGRRALAALVDLGLLAGLLAAAGGLLALAGVLPAPTQSGAAARALAGPGLWLVPAVTGVAVVAAWVRLGGTPGKLLLGVRLVDARTGAPLRVGQALARALAYLLSLAPLGLGFWWVLWAPRRRALHDRIAGSAAVIEDESRLELHELLAAVE